MNNRVLRRNNVQQYGNGPKGIVFGHGFGCDQNMWRFVAPSFASTHRVTLFDYVGSGRSERAAYDPQRYASLDGYAQDLLDVCSALDLRDIVFVGHSVSCMIGLLASIREPDRFERLVHVAPSPRYLNDPPEYLGGFERADIEGLLDLLGQNFIGWAWTLAGIVGKHPGIVEELSESFCSTDPATARQFAEVTFLSDMRDALPRTQTPSLVIQCKHDDIVPVAVGEYLHRTLPNCSYRLLDAIGHCPHMSNPREVAVLVREYVQTPVHDLPWIA